jgi:hypothetical protein
MDRRIGGIFSLLIEINIPLLGIVLACLSFNTLAQTYPGLPTRSQNPLLQSYLIPTVPLTAQQDGWSFAHSLYITNTYQTDTSSDENLVIDVENTRYDLQAAYQNQSWSFGLTLSLISNQAGSLDSTINNWHDFFSLPQGGRDLVANNQLQLLYQKNGVDVVNIDQPSSGLGDIQLSASYLLEHNQFIWLTLELPSSDDSELISSQGTDIALAYSASHSLSQAFNGYGTLGLSLLADSGLFQQRLKRQVIFAQYGVTYAFNDDYHFLLQADFHSSMVKNSDIDALGDSLQGQFGLRLPRIFEQHQLDIFFSEDIWPGHAPDITFSLRLSPILF